MKLHLSTDAGKVLSKKVGLVYQLNIAPKVHTPFPPPFLVVFWNPNSIPLCKEDRNPNPSSSLSLKKIGVDEEIYVVDLKKGEVTKGKKHLPLVEAFFLQLQLP